MARSDVACLVVKNRLFCMTTVPESIFDKQQVTTESIFNLNLSIHRQFSLSIEINNKIDVNNQTKEGHAVSI